MSCFFVVVFCVGAVVCGYLFAACCLSLVVRCAFLLVSMCCLFSLVVSW